MQMRRLHKFLDTVKRIIRKPHNIVRHPDMPKKYSMNFGNLYKPKELGQEL